MISTFVQNIKRADTPFYARVKRILKSVLRLNIPVVKWIHLPLYYMHVFVTRTISEIYLKLWATPLFKAYCDECGDGLKLYNGVPYVQGQLKIQLGDSVTINLCTLAGGHAFDDPTLKIGNRSTIGYANTISVSKSVTIGDDVMIAENCFIADNNGHPLHPEKRRQHLPVPKNEIASVAIGNNVWIGRNCVILKGVKIGDNCIIAANTVVTKSIPANTLVQTSPVKHIKDYSRFVRG